MNNDKTHPILITGAGRRIGAHMARRLLESNQPVLAHYRTKTDDITALEKAGADCIAADFADASGVRTFALAVRQRYPQLRGVIHNASSFGPTVADTDQAAQQFLDFFNIHMLTPFILNRELASCLQTADETATDIIHITDIYADNPAPEYDAYCATKAGLQNLALSAAKHLAPKVKVNIIQPGPIAFADWQAGEQQQNVLRRTLLERAGGPEVIYQAVRSILDNEFMTGAVIAVDGGRRWG